MNYNQELPLGHSNSRTQCWRIGLIWAFIVTFGILNFGCDECDCGDEPTVADKYYVK